MKQIVFVVALLFALVGCIATSQESRDQTTVQSQQQIYAQNQPIPRYDYSIPRDTLIQIYNQTIPRVVSTHSYFVTHMGQVVFDCPSRGYPITGGTELTNPTQWVGSGGAVVNQADPDGLFHPATSLGTYVLCVRANGDVVPVYSETDVITLPFEATVQNGRLVDVAASKSNATVNLRPSQ